ncbi:STAS/SEC14 domain-containing protein [Pseudalkalibacillus sp. R45]|uniref:STAS/SEC14 domain-containing protein n=1 Tax=Pseudalkalibacillus sp. R45 TaxID=3457433 RepID=UPI003FCED29B
MFEILPSQDPKTIALEVHGKAGEEDVNKLDQYVEANFGNDEDFNVLAIFGELDGTTFKGLVEGMKFDTKRWDQFNKFAVVSEKSSIEKFTKLGDHLPGITSKHFDKDEEVEAWKWIKQ